MMKANYLIALVCISITACGVDSQGPTTSRADRSQRLKEDLEKTFLTGRIDSARIEKDGVHLKTEKGNIVIPLNELEKRMEVPENSSFLDQLFYANAARMRCETVNCEGRLGQLPASCPYGCD